MFLVPKNERVLILVFIKKNGFHPLKYETTNFGLYKTTNFSFVPYKKNFVVFIPSRKILGDLHTKMAP